jgi:hypothetical protein
MKFKDIKGATVDYLGKEYMTWTVRTNPNTWTTFADIALHDALDANGELGNRIDDLVGYYVSPEDDIDEMVEEFND